MFFIENNTGYFKKILNYNLIKLNGGGIHLDNKNDEENKGKENWKLWDAVFSSGLLSFFKDSQEAQNDDKKFKQLLFQLLFGLIFTALLFGIGFWILI